MMNLKYNFSLYFRKPFHPVPESPAIVSGVKYNEWQRNSGLRVLRKVLDRQKLLEYDAIKLRTNSSHGRHNHQVSKTMMQIF